MNEKTFRKMYYANKGQVPNWWGIYDIPFNTATTLEGDEQYHTHLFYEIFYIEAGRIKHHIELKEYDITEGDLYIIAPNVYHGFQRYEGEPCTHRDVLIGKELMESTCKSFSDDLFDIINSKPYHHIKISNEQISQLNEFFKIFFDLKTEKNKNNQKTLTTVKFIVSFLLGVFFVSLNDKARNSNNVIEQLYARLSLSVYNNKTIPDVLSEFFYNKSYLCRIFKEYSGMNMTDYVNSIRLKRAKNLLLYTNLEVKEIVLQLGFSSESYFFKIFKKAFGITPLQFRKK